MKQRIKGRVSTIDEDLSDKVALLHFVEVTNAGNDEVHRWSPEALAGTELQIREFLKGFEPGDVWAWASSNSDPRDKKAGAIRRRKKFFEIARNFASLRPSPTSWVQISPTEQALNPFEEARNE